MENLLDLLSSFEKLGLKRKEDLIVAFGGGMISDIAGLAASLYMRGMPLVHIPTTLIGQVDASIGAKTGIDHHTKKNIIGTFYAPRQVIIDPLFLKTLPKRELQAGLSEVLKYGLIASEKLWKALAKSIRRLLRGFDTGYEIIIRDAIREKIAFVELDELERQNGVRELLNFGHTFAHGFEAATKFETLLHGEAVALGMRAATWLSMELGYLSGEEWREIEQVLGRLPIPASLEVNTDAVMKAMTGDKKQKGVGYRLVVLKNIGRAEIVSEVSEQKVREAIDFVLGVI
jgi:3-dehydroquinate synthase